MSYESAALHCILHIRNCLAHVDVNK